MSDAAVKPQPSIGHRIVRAMCVIIFFHAFWKMGGFIITVLVGSVFKAGAESDAYLCVSKNVVFLLQTMCLKLFIPVVVPIFKEQLAQEGEEAAWRFGNTVLNLTIVLLALTLVGGMAFAPGITRLIAPGFNERQAELTTRLMRFMFPGVFAICLATVTYALLNSYNVFGYAAAGDAVQKLLWAGVFFVASLTGLALTRMLDAIAVAFLLGAGATLVTHVIGLRSRLHRYRPGLPGFPMRRVLVELAILAPHVLALGGGLWVIQRTGSSLSERGMQAAQLGVLTGVVTIYLLQLWWRARGRPEPMAKFAALIVPLLLGILFAKYRDVLTSRVASWTGTGVFSDLEYARKIGDMPNTLVIMALSIAILPHLCELATGKKWTEFGDVMTHTIRSIVLFFVPLAALVVVLRVPVIKLLLDRGSWSDYHLVHAGDALGLYILSLPFFAIENPIQQSFFAMQRMWTPTLIGFVGTGFHILFLIVGVQWLGFGYFAVVALVYVAARAVKNIILLAVMRYHVQILPWRPSIIFLAKALTVTLGVVLASHFTYQPLQRLLPLDPYRRREVMLDTFNVEPRGWGSENVDDFRIVSKTDEKDAALLKEAFGTTDVVGGENALLARYRRSPRRAAGLRRDLSSLDLTKANFLSFYVSCASDVELTIELVTRERVSFRLEPQRVGGGHTTQVWAGFEALGVGDAVGEVVGLWIRDTTAVARVAQEQTTLIVDNLALHRVVLPKVAYTPGGPVFGERVDSFEAAAESWHLGDPSDGVSVADTKERADRPELALHFPTRGEQRSAWRSLRLHGLDDLDALTFKARADRDCTLTLALANTMPRASGIEPPAQFPVRPREWRSTVALTRTEKRKSYRVPLSAFEGPGPLDRAAVVALRSEAPAGADVWLDNVAFVREPRGPRVRGLSLGYEALKLVHVGVPSALALVVFVGMIFLLRIEEARSTWGWLREHGLGKLRAKLGRGKEKRD